MSRLLIQQLAALQQEFQAAQASAAYVEKQWPAAADDPALKGIKLAHVETVLRNLEQTYLIRLFSEFEGMLRRYLIDRGEKAKTLIDKAASRRRAGIPTAKRDQVHQVRDYRNTIVHPGGQGAPAVTFRQALSALNQYLAYLPDPK